MTLDRATWLEWRRQGIGASDVAAAVTGRYGGPVGVVADKLGIATDDIDPALADRGHRWEQPVADMIRTIYGYHAIGEQMLIEHLEQPLWRCTAEGFLYEEPEATIDQVDTMFEVKTTSTHVRPPWWYYKTQTQWQMFVTGMKRSLLVVLTIDDSEAHTDRELVGARFEWVERDDYVIEQLEQTAVDLWAHVEAKTLPEPSDGSTLAIIRKANAVADSEVPADIDPVADVIATYDELKARAAAADDQLKLHESWIRTAMGEATEAITSEGRWRVRVGEPVRKFTSDSEAEALDERPDYAKTVLDRKRFKLERPDDYERLKRKTADRRMTIKEMT